MMRLPQAPGSSTVPTVQQPSGLPGPALPRIMPGSLGRVAQLVEQGIENPRVGGSIPSSATTYTFKNKGLQKCEPLFFCV